MGMIGNDGLIGAGFAFDKAREGSVAGSSIIRPDDPFFTEVSNELADKGFLVTTTDDLINWARTGSLRWMTFG